MHTLREALLRAVHHATAGHPMERVPFDALHSIKCLASSSDAMSAASLCLAVSPSPVARHLATLVKYPTHREHTPPMVQLTQWLRVSELAAAGASHTLSANSAAANSANSCLLYTSPSPRDQRGSRMPSSA